jgi:anti-anti-sigma regulatory factor
MKQPISISRAMGNVVVTVHGDVDAELLDRTLEAVGGEADHVRLVIDLRDADSIDLRTVEVLVEASRRRRQRGDDLVLSPPRRGQAAQALAGRQLTIAGQIPSR